MMQALQLNTSQKDNHQAKSALMASSRGMDLLLLEYEAARSEIQQLKVLPPSTT